MKILLDSCVWGGAVEVLRAGGHEVEVVAEWPRDPGDEEILAYAFQHDQILITLDKDFGELAVVRRQSHSGIIRLVSLRAEDQGPSAVQALARYGPELKNRGIMTLEPGRVRIRPAEQVDE